MAYKISDECINCGACAAGCPVEAIAEGDAHYEIDPDKCRGCTACSRKCPVNAITGTVKQPHVIDQAKCIKCGTCMDTCRFGAISKK